MIPHTLKNFNLFINGEGFAGRCDEAELPEIAFKMEEHRAGGMDGSFEMDMGQEAMSMKLTLGEPSASVLKALMSGTRIQLRGSFVNDQTNTRIAVLVEIGGRPKKFTPGSWKAGEKAPIENEVAVDYFRWVQAGEELYEIDVINMIRRIGGVDQLAGIRADLGM